MRKLLISLLLLVSWLQGLAQDSTGAKSPYHEVGFDAAPIIRQFVNYTGNNYSLNPYFFLYRFHSKSWALRLALGGTFRDYNSHTSDTTFSDGQSLYFEGRVGVERKTVLSPKWSAYYGVDLLMNYYNDFAVVQETATRSATYAVKNNGYGAAPFLGVRFQINKRISLTTEYSFRAIYLLEHDKRTYEPNPQYGRLVKGEGFQAEFSPYASLYFTYIL